MFLLLSFNKSIKTTMWCILTWSLSVCRRWKKESQISRKYERIYFGVLQIFQTCTFSNHPVHEISYDWPLQVVLFCICHNNICICHNDYICHITWVRFPTKSIDELDTQIWTDFFRELFRSIVLRRVFTVIFRLYDDLVKFVSLFAPFESDCEHKCNPV